MHGSRAGCDSQLIALLAQVALGLERAGTTPPHRFGVAALLGQHLLIILRARAADIRRSAHFVGSFEPTMERPPSPYGLIDPTPLETDGPLLSAFDPFLSAELDLTNEGFAETLRQIFGQGFGGMV